MAFTRKDLDSFRCDNPSCTEKHGPLILHSICHPNDPTWSFYDYNNGILTVKCSICESEIAEILVAVCNELDKN